MTDLNSAPAGPKALTGVTKLPALDFMRSDILSETGPWRDSDPMDGSDAVEPVASLKRLFLSATTRGTSTSSAASIPRETATTRSISIKGPGGRHFQRPGDDHNDHNDVWQDGAVLVNCGSDPWAAYFAMFTQQSTPDRRPGQSGVRVAGRAIVAATSPASPRPPR